MQKGHTEESTEVVKGEAVWCLVKAGTAGGVKVGVNITINY